MVRFFPFLLLVLASCRPSPDAPTHERVLTDDLGRPVEMAESPQRIISLAPNLTEILVAAGGRERLIARSPADDYPPGLDELPLVRTLPLDLEQALSLEPDLLFANEAVNRLDQAERLAEFDIPTYFFSFTELADVPRTLRTIGELLDTDEPAENAASDFERRIEGLRQTQSGHDRPRVLLLIGDQTLYAFGAASYTQELIEVAGGDSITQRFSGEGVTLSREFVLEVRPDVIVGAFGEDYDPNRLVELHPAFRDLPAVRHRRVFSMDPDLIVRAGPRLAEGAEILSELLHAVSEPEAEE